MTGLARIGASLGFLLLTLAGLFLFTDAAHAAVSLSNFSCSGGVATGQLYTTSNTYNTLDMDHLFSFLVGNMEMLSSNLMGHMYCGMINSLSPLVGAAVTLAVVIFGISFTFGIVPMRGSEALKFLIKMGLIVVFATKAEYLIGYGYSALILGVKDGVKIALDGLGGTVNSVDGVYELMDGYIGMLFHAMTDSLDATTGPEQCKNAVFAVMVTMAAAFPMMTYLGLLLLGRLVITFFRAIFGYIYGLAGITFMLTLAPFFLTFAMFKQTHDFFDKWLGYIVSMALQMILLFCFLAFIYMIDLSNVAKSITGIIMYDSQSVEATSIRLPWKYCTLCQFKFIDKDGNDISPGDNDAQKKSFLENATPVCIDSPPKPINVAFGVAPVEDATDPKKALNALMELAGNGLISLIVLAVMVERLLAMIPYLAQRLASGMGANYAPQLGGGGGAGTSLPLPGENILNRFEAGFRQSMGKTSVTGRVDSTGSKFTLGQSGDGISSGARAIGEGVRSAVSGVEQGGVRRGGIRNDFSDWLTDPAKFGGGREP